MRRALSSDSLAEALGDRYPANTPEDFPQPRYTEPRLHGGGRLLTAVASIPGAQSDYAALAVCDLVAGTVGYYRNFGAMRSGTAYPDDMTVVMRSDTVDTVLDLSTGETRESPVMLDRGVRELFTADYENYLSVRTSRADDGQNLVELTAYGEDKPLFTASGGQFYVAGVTPDYALCRYRDGQQAGTLLLRWNRAGALTLHSLLAGETERAGATPIDAYGTGESVAVLARAADGSWFVESFDAKTAAASGTASGSTGRPAPSRSRPSMTGRVRLPAAHLRVGALRQVRAAAPRGGIRPARPHRNRSAPGRRFLRPLGGDDRLRGGRRHLDRPRRRHGGTAPAPQPGDRPRTDNSPRATPSPA